MDFGKPFIVTSVPELAAIYESVPGKTEAARFKAQVGRRVNHVHASNRDDQRRRFTRT